MAALQIPEVHTTEVTRHFFENLFNYTFRDVTWLPEALYAGEPTIIGTRCVKDENKGLAWIGDAALQLVATHECFLKSDSKGEASNMRTEIVRNTNLAAVGRAHGFERFIYTGPVWRPVGTSTMAATVEALLGALYMDSNGGLGLVKRAMVMLGLIEDF